MRHSMWRVMRFALLWALLVGMGGVVLVQPATGNEAKQPESEQQRAEVVVVAEADSYLASNHPDENYGDVGGLFIGYSIGAENLGATRTVLRFPIPDEIPPNVTVTDARVELYLTYANPSTDTPMETKLRQLLSAWDEDSVTWNSEPLWDPNEVLVTADVGDQAGVYQWSSDELAAVVEGWISGETPNHGLHLQGDETMELGRERVFYSTEATVGAELMPRLFIDYTLDETAPNIAVEPLPPFSPETFVVSWGGEELGGSGIDYYEVRYRVDGGEWILWLSGVSDTSAEFTGEDGRFYEFEARGVDQAGNEEPWVGPEASTTVDVTPATATVNPLPALLLQQDFTVSWTGSDEVEISCYDVQYSFNNGPWVLWIKCTTDTSALFTATEDGVYRFEARARDVTGQIEPFLGEAEAITQVDAEPPFLEPSLWLPIVLNGGTPSR